MRYVFAWLLTSFWFRPLIISALAIPLFMLTYWLDTTSTLPWLTNSELLFRFSVEGARQILSVIIGSLITVTSLVFSMTLIALSNTASQLGPRLIQMFSSGSLPQIMLGSLIGNLIVGLLLFQAIGDPITGVEFAPALSLSTSIVGIISNLGFLVYFLHHTSKKIDADAVVATMGSAFGDAIATATAHNGTKSPLADYEAVHNRAAEHGYTKQTVIPANASGYIQTINVEALVKLAQSEDMIVEIETKPGRFMIDGTHLGTVQSKNDADPALANKICKANKIGRQRTHAQDLEFSIAALVEIALRALSPGVNDPYTAITCIDWLAAGLAQSFKTGLPAAAHRDGDDMVRVVVSPVTYEGLLNTALSEIRQQAAGKIAIVIRLLEMLQDLVFLAETDEQRLAVRRHANNVIRLSEDIECDEFDSQALFERVRQLKTCVAESI